MRLSGHASRRDATQTLSDDSMRVEGTHTAYTPVPPHVSETEVKRNVGLIRGYASGIQPHCYI